MSPAPRVAPSDPDPRDYARLASRILSETPGVRDSVTRGALSFDRSRRAAYAEIDAEGWRRWAEEVKSHLLGGLDAYLEEAEARLLENGARVHWAGTAADAREIVGRIAEDHAVRSVVKGKSMLSEEVELDGLLEERGAHVLETDLGEYIIQLLGEPPSHIIAPAVHRSLDDVRRLFHEELGTPADGAPEALLAEARRVLRRAFLEADMGVTGGNFLVAETGTLALIENEGNIRLTTSLPPVHVALVGVEKLLPRLADLASFLQLTSRAATGQALGTFVSLLHGPRGPEEADGPEELHVVLVDNGRSRVLADPEAWETLRCVRCGACLNACPVYRQTGGHAYGWVYPGPIGAVLAPGLLGLEAASALPQASSLCGACFDACPVRIPIPELLHVWRRRSVEAGLDPARYGVSIRAYARAMTRPRLYRLAGRALRALPRAVLNGRILPVLGAWSGPRAGLEPSPRSFRDLWEEGIE